MEKIKIELEATKDISAYVADTGAVNTDKHIVYQTEGEGLDTKLARVAEVTPRILLGEFPVAVEIPLGERDGVTTYLMLNLQDLIDRYNEEYENAKA